MQMLFVLGVVLFILSIPSILYPFSNHIKPLQKFYCRIGWHCHQNDYIIEGYDGMSVHCTCKWCGYKGMVDSQGNLF